MTDDDDEEEGIKQPPHGSKTYKILGRAGGGGGAAAGNGNAAAAADVADAAPAAEQKQRSESPDEFPIHIDLPAPTKSAPNSTGGPGYSTGAGVPRSASAGGMLDASWETPHGGFEDFVADVVRHRIGKYEQPDHPSQLSRDEASSLFRAIRREIVAKEVNAFEERNRTNQQKPIERQKLENRIKDYVRERVRKYHASRAGGQ
jgi:hypothetical protein